MPAVPVLALATAVVGTGYSIYAGERANAQQKKATQLQKQQADLQAMRQKRDAIRQARMAAAAAAVTSESQGVSGSSSAQGGQGSIFSQLDSNLSFLDQSNVLADQASDALGKMRNYEYLSRTAGQAASLGFSAYAHSSEIQSVLSQAGAKVKKVFSG